MAAKSNAENVHVKPANPNVGKINVMKSIKNANSLLFEKNTCG
jgi:hypothetical protein